MYMSLNKLIHHLLKLKIYYLIMLEPVDIYFEKIIPL